MKVLDYGSLNYDYVYQVDHILVGGETSAAISMEAHIGGKGLNQAVALKKAGLNVYLAGCLGADGMGIRDLCKKEGINTEYLASIEGKSGHTIIQVDKDAQNCIMLYGGSNRKQEKSQIDRTLGNFGTGDILLLQNEINHLDYLIDKAFEMGMTIVLNPSPFDDNLEKCDMSKVDYFIMNEIEGRLLTGKESYRDILSAMRHLFPKAKTVLTVGKEGAYYQDENVQVFQEAFPVKAVDTTAAGDTFTGYFISGLVNGTDIQKNLRMCARASSIAVKKKGATNSIPEYADVLRADAERTRSC
jgi:ribokinase